MAEITKRWDELKKRYNQYNLPDAQDITREFDAEIPEDTGFPTRAVITKIEEQIDHYAGIIADILQPDPASMHAVHETQAFDDEDKKWLYSLYTKLLVYHRNCMELSLMNIEEENALFIAQFYKDWPSLKMELKRVITKMKESWGIKGDLKDDLGYFG